jgi:hypothetical protein
MSLAAELRSDVERARVERVKALAARITRLAEGTSVREFLDACALAAGALICNFYRGHGVKDAGQRFADAFTRAVNKNG